MEDKHQHLVDPLMDKASDLEFEGGTQNIPKEFLERPVLHPLVEDPKSLNVDADLLRKILENGSAESLEHKALLDKSLVGLCGANEEHAAAFLKLVAIMMEQTNEHAETAKLMEDAHKC